MLKTPSNRVIYFTQAQYEKWVRTTEAGMRDGSITNTTRLTEGVYYTKCDVGGLVIARAGWCGHPKPVFIGMGVMP